MAVTVNTRRTGYGDGDYKPSGKVLSVIYAPGTDAEENPESIIENSFAKSVPFLMAQMGGAAGAVDGPIPSGFKGFVPPVQVPSPEVGRADASDNGDWQAQGDFFTEWGNTSARPHGYHTQTAIETPRGLNPLFPEVRTAFGDVAPMEPTAQAPAPERKVEFPWDSVARPDLKSLQPFMEPPKYNVGNERKRISNAVKTAKWAVPLTLLMGMRPSDALGLTGNLFSGMQTAIQQDEQNLFARSSQENAMANDFVKTTNNAIQYENANKIDAYNREITNKIRNAEFNQRVLDAEADRKLKEIETLSKVQDREERIALAKSIEERKAKGEKIKALLSTIGNNRITPEAEERLAAQVRELGIDIPPDVYYSMSPEMKEKYELMNRSQAERERHWKEVENEKRREFDAKLLSDQRRAAEANATKKAVANIQAAAKRSGALGKNPGLSTAYRVYSKQAEELSSLAASIRQARTAKRQFDMQAMAVLKDPQSVNPGDPTGLNDFGKRRRAEYDQKAAEEQSKIERMETEYEMKKVTMGELLNSGFSDAVFQQQQQQTQQGQIMAVMGANGQIIGYNTPAGFVPVQAAAPKGVEPGAAVGGTPGKPQGYGNYGTGGLFAPPGVDTRYGTTNQELFDEIAGANAMNRAGAGVRATPKPNTAKRAGSILGMRPAGGR